MSMGIHDPRAHCHIYTMRHSGYSFPSSPGNFPLLSISFTLHTLFIFFVTCQLIQIAIGRFGISVKIQFQFTTIYTWTTSLLSFEFVFRRCRINWKVQKIAINLCDFEPNWISAVQRTSNFQSFLKLRTAFSSSFFNAMKPKIPKVSPRPRAGPRWTINPPVMRLHLFCQCTRTSAQFRFLWMRCKYWRSTSETPVWHVDLFAMYCLVRNICTIIIYKSVYKQLGYILAPKPPGP